MQLHTSDLTRGCLYPGTERERGLDGVEVWVDVCGCGAVGGEGGFGLQHSPNVTAVQSHQRRDPKCLLLQVPIARPNVFVPGRAASTSQHYADTRRQGIEGPGAKFISTIDELKEKKKSAYIPG